MGTVITFPLSGYLAYNTGWPSIFYVTGGVALVWFFLWLCVGGSTPDRHSFISKKERQFIEISLIHIEKETVGSYVLR